MDKHFFVIWVTFLMMTAGVVTAAAKTSKGKVPCKIRDTQKMVSSEKICKELGGKLIDTKIFKKK